MGVLRWEKGSTWDSSGKRYVGQIDFMVGRGCAGIHKARHPNVLTTDEEIEAALERARRQPPELTIVEALYRPEPELNLLVLTLSDGCRLLVPCEDLSELKDATTEQIADLQVGLHGVSVWWPQLDDGIYFPEFLEFRWGNRRLVDRRDGGARYRVGGLE